MPLGRLTRVILYVRDMGAQVAFYRDVLGLNLTFPDNLKDYSSEHWVLFGAGPCGLALHAGGETRIGPDAPKIVFDCDDIRVMREQLLSRGVAMGEIRSPSPGVLVSDGRDPEGNRFSIESCA
jgi:predicted enzyme related to lactoylglutathione lyase